MSDAGPSTADLLARIALLEATVSTQKAAIAERDEQIRDLAAERAAIALRIQKLELQIARHNGHSFGRSSEKIGQLYLELEDLEADLASGPVADLPSLDTVQRDREPSVRALSATLPRKRIVIEPPSTGCPGCGGTLRPMGEDADEVLDLVAQAWQVLQTVRPKYSCRVCETIVQAPALPKAIARGKLSFATLAHVMVAKWGYHLPFYRQAQMMAAKGVDVERSTLARSAGYAAFLLDPIYNRIRELGRLRFKIHTDDTRLPILAPGMGKTHKGALWAYAVDDRNSGSQEPPLIWFRATQGRAGENVMTELGDFTGSSRPMRSPATTSSIGERRSARLPASRISGARSSMFTTRSQPRSAPPRWPASRRSIRSRTRYVACRRLNGWRHAGQGHARWSALFAGNWAGSPPGFPITPRSPKPSAMAPDDGGPSTASSTMAGSSRTT